MLQNIYSLDKKINKFRLVAKNLIFRFVIKITARNTTFFYGDYKGNINRLNLLIKNLLKPTRAKIIIKNRLKKKNLVNLNETEKKYLSILKLNGAVRVPKFISTTIVENLLRGADENCSGGMELVSKFDGSSTQYNYCPITKEVEDIYCNKENMISTCKKLF
jgi:hypothetical protein